MDSLGCRRNVGQPLCNQKKLLKLLFYIQLLEILGGV